MLLCSPSDLLALPLFCCLSTFFAFLFSNPHLRLLLSGEVIDGNSGAPAKGNSGFPSFSPYYFFCLDSSLTWYFLLYWLHFFFLHRPLRDRRPAMADGEDPYVLQL